MTNERQNETTEAKQRLSQKTILIVEDDKIGLGFIQEMLRAAGYRVHSAPDGLGCLNKVSQVHPDLIVMDVVMPNMDGIEACRQLKAEQASGHIPVIFVTGNTDDETLKRAFDAGGSDYVRKPVRQVELLARVRTALNEQAMMRRLAEKEKLKGILETAGGICHELNQPLQYVLGVIQLMLMDVSPEDESYTHLDGVRESVEQMGMITKKLMEITHLKAIKYSEGMDIIDVRKSISDPPE